MLKPGDVLQFSDPACRVRILWLSVDAISAAVIDIDAPQALPEMMDVKVVRDAIESEQASLLDEATGMTFVAEAGLSEARKRVRRRAWKLIGLLVTDVPRIFSSNYRGKEVDRVVAEARDGDDEETNKTTKKQVYAFLRRYWQRGMTINSLLSDHPKCGGRGKTRKSGKKKRGRPRKYGSSVGINITEEIRKVFRVGFSRCYASDRKRTWSLQDAFDKIISDFFCEKQIDPETGKVTHIPLEEVRKAGGLPTIKQFQYWSEKDHVRLDVKRKRVGAKIYDKDMRGLLGTSAAEVMGPGDRYQIDATIVDVYLVSRLDRNKIIGRPVLYVVIDVFSRMVVGIYVGLEGPSWVGAMMALANTAADKVAYCKQFGIEIDPEDWPCHFLPGALLGDGGEIKSETIATLLNNFNVIVENTASYRADWKGAVEQRFRLIPAKFKPFVPGYIQQDFRARGGRDYRLDAVLDIDEFTADIIEILLYFNNHHEIEKYDKNRDVVADGVPAIPAELWDWGRHYRSGSMRVFPEELVQYSLMPKDKAMVTELGIRFKDAYYTCQAAMDDRWFDKARQDGRWELEASYDPRCLDAVYLPGNGKGISFHRCTMTERSRALKNISLAEAEQQALFDGHAKADRQESSHMARLDLAASLEARTEQAKQKKDKPTEQSDASRTKDIRSNRSKEKEARRTDEAFRPGQPPRNSERPSAEVVPFPGKRPASDGPDYSLPSIDEILGDDDDDGV